MDSVKSVALPMEVAYLLISAQGAMVWWSERLLVKQEDLGSNTAQTKCFTSLLGYEEVGIK